MSDSDHASTNRSTQRRPNASTPRAVIHKQILNAAGSDPGASMETIANEVSGATTALVEKVLREYGDPAAEHEQEDENESEDSMTDEPTADETSTSRESEPEPELESDASTTSSDSDSNPSSDSSLTSSTTLKSPSSEIDEGDTDREGTDPGDDTDGNAPEETLETDGDVMDEGELTDEAVEVPDPTTLTAKQLETLRAISERPNATQTELATQFDVTGATISQRVNSIDGFDWSERRTFIEALFESDDDGDIDEAIGSASEPSAASDTGSESGRSDSPEAFDTGDKSERDSRSSVDDDGTRSEETTEATRLCRELAEQLSALTAQVDRLERQLAERSGFRASPSTLADPILAHKVVHACLRSDHISEAEELQILQEVLGVDRNRPVER